MMKRAGVNSGIVKTVILFVLLFSFNPLAESQTLAETKMVLVSENALSKPVEYYTETATMQLNLANGDFILKADLSDLKTGNRKLDSLIRLQDEQPVVFKGNIGETILAYSQQQNDEQTYNMPGQLFINGNSLSCTAQFDPLNLADKNEVRNYRMDLKLQIDPEKIPLKIPDLKFTKQVVLEITGGRLNTQN